MWRQVQPMIPLDILSDPICPWCLIGKTQLDRALSDRGSPFRISWHPFQLNPDMPRGGMDRRAYLETKFGGKENAAAVYARIDRAAEAAGLSIDWGSIRRTPNTLDAHRVLLWAGLEDRQDAVADGLFGAYFREGRDIGDREVLADIAGAAGMDREVIARLLSGTTDEEEVRTRDAHARQRGVQAVPTFIVAERHVVPGAQPPELWARVIEELTAVPEGVRPS